MFTRETLRRPSALLITAVLLFSLVLPLAMRSTAYAGLLTSRTIKLSSSKGGDTGVSYDISFVTATTGNIGGLVVDICSTTPIIGDTCTAPSGFKWHAKSGDNTATLTQPGDGGSSAITDFSKDTTNTTDNKLVLTRTAASVSSGQTVNITVVGVENPTASNTSFYARILTYAVTATAQAYTSGTPGAYADAGGSALSTADQITIQAKVQERLTFCVYTSAAAYTSCGSVSTTNPVVLGDANGVLSPTLPSINKSAKYNVTTNASNGVTIRAKGAVPTSGSNTIDAIAAGNSSGTTSTTGSEQFGLCTYRDTGGGTTGLTASAPYNSASCSGTTAGQGAGNDNSATFGYDTTTSNDNVTSTYGDTIATKTAGDFSTGILVFLGNISNATEPGIYTSTLTFIATGNY